jgi:hypothetical protein
LGNRVADFIQDTCVVPDGDYMGTPYILTEEMIRFLQSHYRLDPKTGVFVHRGSQLVRPQKWGKGPFSAAIICAEAAGEVLFDGWDANGEPVGRPWSTPWIQVTAVSEDQTDNVWRALVPMIDFGSLKAEIPDTGLTRINLPGGGLIEPVTSSARSRLGQRITFSVQDETHSWTKTNGGRALADNQRRNLAGMGGRWLETTNAWDPAEDSVAQQTSESKAPDIYKDHSESGPGSIRNKQERRKMLRKVYRDSWWVDRDRIDAEIVELLDRDPAQAERFFLNRIQAASDAAFDLGRWKQLANPSIVVPDRSQIVIGVDGARSDDALAVIAIDLKQSHQFVLGIWERPAGAPPEYEHSFDDVDGVMIQAFAQFKVWRVYIDPGSQTGNISSLVDRWEGRWGKTVVEFPTHVGRRIAHAVADYTLAINAGELSHDGDSIMARHIGNARRRPVGVLDENNRRMWTIAKDRDMSKNKMDAAMAGVISWAAYRDAIAAGLLNRPPSVYESRGVELL